MKDISSELTKIRKNEEIKAKLRSRERKILEGDRKHCFFHAIMIQRRRKKQSIDLEGRYA
jgi:hypothetical protein